MNKELAAVASCNGCDRELLGSMHTNIDLNLTGLIIPWKKSAKGKRTSSRRPRDVISNGFRSVDELINKVPVIPEMTVSNSEKLGVTVLGCRFSGKTGNEPIKKRKFMVRSPSPPPRSSFMCHKKTEMLLKNQLEAIDCTASNSYIGQIVDTEKGTQGKNLTMEGKYLDSNEDFSGISLLAALACSTSLGGGVNHVEKVSGVEGSLVHEAPSMDNSYSFVKSFPSEHLSSTEVSAEGTRSSLSAVPAEELVASSGMDSSPTKFASQVSKEHNESVQDHSVVVLEDVLAKRDEGICRDHEIPSCTNRLHWDLNTPMESWERPLDYLCSDSHADIAEGTAEGTKYDNCMGKMNSSQDDLVDGDTGCSYQMPSNEKKFSPDMEFRLQTCVTADSTICLSQKLCCSSGYINPISAVISSASTHVDKSFVSQCPTLGSTGHTERVASGHVVEVDNVVTHKSSHFSSNCVLGAAFCDATVICFNNKDSFAGSAGTQFENDKSTDVTSSDSTVGGEPKHIMEAADMRDSGDVPPGCQPLKSELVNDVRENSLCQSDGASLSSSSVLTFDSKLKNELITHGRVAHEISHVAHEKIGQPTISMLETTTELSDSPPGFSSSKPYRDSDERFVNSFGKVALEEPFENGNGSDVSHDEASMKGASFVVDYDSQYEDGEVRESIEHTWEEYDGQDMESEDANYALYYINLATEAGQMLKNMQSADLQPCRSSLRGKDASTAINIGDIHHDFISRPDKKTKDIGFDVRLDDMITRSSKFDAGDRTRIVETRALRREFVEERTYNDGFWRKERGKFSKHAYSGGGGDRENDTGMRRHQSPNYRGSIPFRHRGQEHNMHQRFTRYRSPHDREDTFGLPMPKRPSRDWSPSRRLTRGRGRGRGRGRSMQYGTRVEERSPRDRYHGHIPDDRAEFPLKHPSANRERSFSPSERRDARTYRSHSKSSSRSRSPNPGNPCFRQQGRYSKSFNFRSDIRNQRRRSPHGSPPPPRSTRWIGDRKENVSNSKELGYNEASPFLDRRAYGRFGRQDDRFAMVDSPQNLRHMHSGRFTERI